MPAHYVVRNIHGVELKRYTDLPTAQHYRRNATDLLPTADLPLYISTTLNPKGY